MNCLAYALEFWYKHPRYQIFYDGDHMVNMEVRFALPMSESELATMTGMVFLKDNYSYEHISKSFAGLLTEPQEKLLRKYYGINN